MLNLLAPAPAQPGKMHSRAWLWRWTLSEIKVPCGFAPPAAGRVVPVIASNATGLGTEAFESNIRLHLGHWILPPHKTRPDWKCKSIALKSRIGCTSPHPAMQNLHHKTYFPCSPWNLARRWSPDRMSSCTITACTLGSCGRACPTASGHCVAWRVCWLCPWWAFGLWKINLDFDQGSCFCSCRLDDLIRWMANVRVVAKFAETCSAVLGSIWEPRHIQPDNFLSELASGSRFAFFSVRLGPSWYQTPVLAATWVVFLLVHQKPLIQ